jgi:chaperonin GroES
MSTSTNTVEGISVPNIIPMRDRVVVLRDEEEILTPSGMLYKPETATEKPSTGIVLSVGDGRVLDNGTVFPILLVEGDKVYFGKYAGVEIEVDNSTYTILREDEVIARKERKEQVRG